MKNDFQPIKSDMQQERDKLCYLTIGDKDEKWGVVVTTIGYQFIPPGTKYPLSAHPDKYSFMPRGGRILNEYQLVYITKGSGYFASHSCPEAPVKAGTVMLLFPGEWHSYHPDDATGWDEYWVGFKGSYIDDRVANRFLAREQPLHNIGISSGIVSLYEEILQLASAEKAGCQQMMSSIVLHILGSIYYKERNNSYANTFILEKVNAARELMKDVDEILGAYLRLEERAVGLRTEEKTVRIGSVYPLAPGTIPHMLKEFGATFPFIIYNRMTPEIAEGLLDGKYDIGFCSDLLKSDEIEYYPIRDSYIAVVVPKGHPLENRERISLKETAGYPQIMFSKTSGFRTLQEQIFAEEGIKVKPVCAAEEIEVITGLVENGFGISVLPYMDIVRLHNVVTIPVKTSGWNSKFYIARRKYGIRSEQEEAFFQYWKKEHH